MIDAANGWEARVISWPTHGGAWVKTTCAARAALEATWAACQCRPAWNICTWGAGSA